jgi:membrane fusion protein, multidrug efflux system
MTTADDRASLANKRGRRWWITRVGVPVTAGIVVIGAGAAALSSGSGGATSEKSTGVAEVAKRTISDRESFSGTLGYADSSSVMNQLSGTVTWVRAEGSTVATGKVLYKVDNKSVYLMDGDTPAYRTMNQGDEGPDVKQLEQSLKKLGFDDDGDMTVDNDYTSATAAAVRDWQEAKGLSETGEIELGRVVFQRGDRRIGTIKAVRGSSVRAGQAIMDSTSTRRAVTVSLDARRQDLVTLNAKERVTLPDGSQINATISKIGVVAKSDSDGGSSKIDVTLVLDDTKKVTALDSAPVDVEITKETHKDVLAVPITALLALDGGGYGVEVVGGNDARTILAVEPGLFSDSYVEISGDGIAASKWWCRSDRRQRATHSGARTAVGRQKVLRRRPGPSRRESRHRRGGVRRHCRAIGLRQEHTPSRHGNPRPSNQRGGLGRRAGGLRNARRRRRRGAFAQHRLRLPAVLPPPVGQRPRERGRRPPLPGRSPN